MTADRSGVPRVSEPDAGGNLHVRMRKDLICRPRVIDGIQQYVIKDPLAMAYHYYQEPDFFLLSCLDGVMSFQEIRSAFESRFGRAVTDLHFQHFLMAVVRDRLVLTNLRPARQAAGNLPKRKAFGFVWAVLRNPLAIRLPPVDLSRVFDALMPVTRWVVHPVTIAAILVLALFSMLLVAFNFTEFQQRLPLASEFFALHNLFLLMVVLGMTKVLHEFGHALTCRQFGAECRHVGVMLLVFTPCLYCDVTDAWMIDSRWRRILIASAGMLVELFLASVSTLLWWTSEPGVLNSLCLNVMFVSGVSTVLFNGNPLLRYDGYYILSDWVDIPNLWSRSRKSLQAFGDRVLFGLPAANLSGRTWRRSFMLVYAIGSKVYRMVVLFGILYFVVSLMKSFHFFQVSLLLAGMMLAGVMVPPVVASVNRRRQMVQQKKISRFRLLVVYGALGLAGWVILAVPLPCRISVPGYVEVASSERIHVATPGVLVDSMAPGTTVVAGQVIARLDSPELAVEARDVQRQYDQCQSRLGALDALRNLNPLFGNRIPTERENAEELKARLGQIQERIEQLELKSTQGGTVLAPRDRVLERQSPFELGSWDGSPLETRNRLALLDKGTLLCLVGDPSQMEGFALVPQSVSDLVKAGQPVQMQVSGSPDRVQSGTIVQLAPLENVELPADLRSLITSRFGRELRLNEVEFGTMYLATIQFDDQSLPLLNFESLTARIAVEPRSLGSRLIRYLRRTFVFLAD